MPILNCAWCNKETEIRQYRIKPGVSNCCSSKCSAKLRVSKGVFDHMALTSEKIAALEFDYFRTPLTLEAIAEKHDVSRSAISRYAKLRHWKKFQRTATNRTLYRRAAAKKLGRNLRHGEHVHHIDGHQPNNEPGNLHVFSGPKEHSECHASLEEAAFILFRKGLIRFNAKTGRYSAS